MRYLKHGILVLALAALGVSVSQSVWDAGVHGVILLVACALPAVLAALGIAVWKAFPRWAAVVSLVSFLLAGLKTSGDSSSPLANAMVAAFFGMIVAAVLAIKPDRGEG